MPKFLWTFKVLIKKPANTQIGCPFYVTCVFSLATYIIILFVMNLEGFHCNVILGINFVLTLYSLCFLCLYRCVFLTTRKFSSMIPFKI